MISLTNVRLEHETPSGSVLAVDKVNLQVEAGEYVALLGASGSGKTTLLNLIGGLVSPTAGDVEVAGQRVNALTEAGAANLRLASIGIVFQDNNLIAEFSALENVMLPLRARGWTKQSAVSEATRLLTDVGLAGLEGRKPVELSGGQKQRVGIARGLAGDRRVLLADEPTGALDSTTSRAVFELLQTIASQGVAVVVVTHDPLVVEYASRVISIRDGTIIDDSVGARSI